MLATHISAVLLGVLFLAVGAFHLRGSAAVAQIAARTGHSLQAYRLIGLAEAAGGIGLLIGLAVTWIGVAAGIGLTLLMAGAVITHLRIGDGPRQWSASALLAILAAITAALLITA